MRELISRQAAIDAIAEADVFVFYDKDTPIEDAVEIAIQHTKKSVICSIEELPSAGSEIIKCKDCKHQVKEWRDDKRFKDKGYWVYGCMAISDICGYWAWGGEDDEFCFEAERRTDG